MCGIAGLLGPIDHSVRKKAIEAIGKRLTHRGKDGAGTYEDDNIALVHTRLSIIDVSAQGSQPLYNEDERIVLICNGEIYNYKELRSSLIKKGHKFRSASDSEVILHLYEEHGHDLPRMINMLTGMFAFALWDKFKKKLILVRDRLGMKPLYYHYNGRQVFFSSEVNTMDGLGLFRHSTDITSVYEYFLLGSIPGPHTCYEEVRALEPGHYLVCENSRISSNVYWDVPLAYGKWKNDNEVADATEHLLSAIVKEHMVADVPVGTFLSAGVDSSLITAIASGYNSGIHSFTASFPGEPEDELNIARATAQTLKAKHYVYELTSAGFFGNYANQMDHSDQPFAISSALSLGCLSGLAREQVKVVLSGDGADELFGGYARHDSSVLPRFLRYFPPAMHDTVLSLGSIVTRKESIERLRQNMRMSPARKMLGRIQVNDTALALSCISQQFRREVDPERFTRRLSELFNRRKEDPDTLNNTLYADVKTTLVDEMLTKVDRMTLINGVEGRTPFLDHRMVELAFSIPGKFKRKDGIGKLPLRKILAARLGHELAYRQKTGFNSPLHRWLKTDKGAVDFARWQINKCTTLPFLNPVLLDNCARKPEDFSPAIIYPLLCLGAYNSNKGITAGIAKQQN